MMLDQIREFLTHQFQNNELFTGGAILMVLGTLAHSCRTVPLRLFNRMKRFFIIELDIPDRDEAFRWLNRWLAEHPYSKKRARLLTVKTERPSDQADSDDDDNRRPNVVFAPAPGLHWFFYKRRLVLLTRERNEAGGEGGIANFMPMKESFTLRIFSRNRKLVQELLDEARELWYPASEKRITILTTGYDEWYRSSKRRPRPVESVVLRAGVMEELIAVIEKFKSREQWYIDRGIPHRLGILLIGPPGSGKSSAVVALASHFSSDIGILSLADSELDDMKIGRLLSDTPKNCFILVEDIDCAFDDRTADEADKAKRKKDRQNRLTFSGLLNSIDGVAAGEGRIMFYTTNHPEKLDPALIRPGRADVHVEIGLPTEEQIGRIFKRFFPNATAGEVQSFVSLVGDPTKTSMAAMQTHLTKYSDNINLAIVNAAEAQA